MLREPFALFERQAIEISAQSGQMVSVDNEERLYTGIWTAFKMRHGWLQVNLLSTSVPFMLGLAPLSLRRYVMRRSLLCSRPFKWGYR